MFTLDDILRLLEGHRRMVLQMAEVPKPEDQTQFGFGSVSGRLQLLRALQDDVQELAETKQGADGEE